MMLPSPSDLEYFLEIVGTKHISRAAIRLGLSQPSLTLAVQRIERKLGAKIFIRCKGGLTLTKAGEQLLLKASTLLRNWEELRNLVGDSHSELAGILTVGCHPEVAIDSLPLFLTDLMEEFPRLEIKLVHDLSRKIVEGVVGRGIDIGIAVNPYPHPDLIIKKLSEDFVCLWTAPGKRKLQDLASGEAIVICNMELKQTHEILRKLPRKGIRIKRTLHSEDMEVISSLVASGAGLGILPSEAALRNRGHGLIPLSKLPKVKDEVGLIYRVEKRTERIYQEVSKRIIIAHNKKYQICSGSKP